MGTAAAGLNFVRQAPGSTTWLSLWSLGLFSTVRYVGNNDTTAEPSAWAGHTLCRQRRLRGQGSGDWRLLSARRAGTFSAHAVRRQADWRGNPTWLPRLL